MRRVALLAFLAGRPAFPAGADAARVAIGISEKADVRSVSAAVEARTGTRPESLRPIPVLLADLPAGTSLRGIAGIRYVEPLMTRHLAFTPGDPLVSKQWYLGYSGFYSSWLTLPSFEPIPVAVIDSGVDAAHPDLAGRSSTRGASSPGRHGWTRSDTAASWRGSSAPEWTTVSALRASRRRPSSSSRRS